MDQLRDKEQQQQRKKNRHILPKYFTEKNIALLHALCRGSHNNQRSILINADKELIQCICDCALNILHGTVKLDGKSHNKLSKFKKILRKIVESTKSFIAKSKKRRKNLWKQKKRLLRQKGAGAFLPALLAPVISTLIATIIDHTFKR